MVKIHVYPKMTIFERTLWELAGKREVETVGFLWWAGRTCATGEGVKTGHKRYN